MNLAVLFLAIESIVANPIIYRLVPRPSRFETRQWDCAADDLSHYDVTSEPVREVSMAAKR